MTYNYKKYEWTAFTEADLLGAGSGNGHSISNGDSFTMPGSATVCMSTYDNDNKLSGDNNEHATDWSGQKATVDGHRVGSQMYAEKYWVLHGSDGQTYYMIEIEVEGYDAPGVGDDFFTFYGAVPPAGVELSVSHACNVSGHWVDYSCLGAGDKAPANTPPHFTNLPSDGIICIDENTTFVIDVNSNDADGDNVTYEIVGGVDASKFEIDAHTGELTFKDAPDFENPTSANGNNTYDVTVKVSDGNGGSDTKALWVKVKDVDEGQPDCIVIEAEHMNKWGFSTKHSDTASNGAIVKLGYQGSGDLWTTFNGMDGKYDLDIHLQDENDGCSTIMVKVNGHVVETITLNQNGDGGGSDHGPFSVVTVQDLMLNDGDQLSLWAQAQGGEFVRIDKLELCKDGEPCPEGFGKLDFEGLARGTTVFDQFDGVTITAMENDAHDSATDNDAMIFDSNNPTGGDHDLAYNGRGNILIITEDDDAHDPDDSFCGGMINFAFDNPSDLHDIVLLDIEEAGGTIELTFADGSTQTIAIPAAGNNSAQTIDLNATNVTSMKITLVGSGAVDDLCWKPGEDPIPASVAGTYFMDTNDNSVEDGADMAVAGATVVLLQNGAEVARTTTDANGDYLFADVAAGSNYSVRFIDTGEGKVFVDGDVGGDDTVDSDVVLVGGAGNGNTASFDLAEGENKTDVDAGIEDPGTAAIEGKVFMDNNDDSLDNAGDMPVGGVTVELLNSDGTPTGLSTTTAADGTYSFTGLDAGDYIVQFPTDVDGKVLVTQDVDGNANDADDSDASEATGQTGVISVGIGETSSDNDAGVEDPGTASIGDTVFLDENGNGVQDNGEGGVEGVTVTLTGAGADGVLGTGDDTTATDVTDANGDYGFDGLDAGDYKVTFDASATGLDFTTEGADADDAVDGDSDADQVTGMTDTITLDIGEDEDDIDAGLVDPAGSSISGRIFMDNNDNSLDDAEMGLGGVTVILETADGAFIDETTTNADGSYSFDNLPAGEYQVDFPTEVDGKVLVDANAGDDTIDSDATQPDGETGTIVLGINEDIADVDAGFEDPGTAVIEGKVFMDNDDDSLNGNGDMALGGVTVELLNADGTPTGLTTTTAPDGTYSFTGLAAGAYIVAFPTGVEGKELVDQNAGDDTIDSDAGADGQTDPIVVGIGETSSDNDAGYADPGSAAIEGKVFMDNDDDSLDGNGDMPVGGVTVELLNSDGTPTGLSTTTAPDGTYSFTGLDAGDYIVQFPTDVDGKVLVTQDVDGNANDADDSDASEATGQTGVISVGIGETSSDNDAGVEDPGTASVGDTVFLDENENGVRDTGEDGVEGVVVTLTGAGADGVFGTGDDTTATDTTDVNGNYLFEDLDAGDYKVTFDASATGLDFTIDSPFADDEVNDDSDADQTTGMTDVFTLDIGEDERDIDAGLVPAAPASVGDTVFIDVNGNGVRDDGEPGLEGVTVTLTGAGDDGIIGTGDDTTAVDVTDANGNYLFEDLEAGDYKITFDATTAGAFVFTNEGADVDTLTNNDSDADEVTGMTDVFTLVAGQDERNIDAGVVSEDPNAVNDDAGKTCANEDVTVDVLANDTDDEPLTITAVNGEAISEGGTVVVDGVNVTLVGGELVIDGEAAYEFLDIGEEATQVISYTVSDGLGGEASADVSVTFCGVAETLQEICDSLPEQVQYEIRENYSAGTDEAFDIRLTSTDARLDGLEISSAYCVSIFDLAATGTTFDAAPLLTGDLYCTLDDLSGVLAGQVGANGQSAADNMDLVNWILNQDFNSADYAGEGFINGVGDAEIQIAVWTLTDGAGTISAPFGEQADVDAIVALAEANGEGFESGAGDKVGLIIDPNPETATNAQPFIVAVDFDDLDCIC